MEHPFIAPVEKGLTSIDVLSQEQATVARKLIVKANTIAGQKRAYKYRIECLEEDMGHLERLNEVLEEKLLVAVILCETIPNKYYDTVTNLGVDLPAIRSEIEFWDTKYNKQSECVTELMSELEQVKNKLSQSNTRNLNKK